MPYYKSRAYRARRPYLRATVPPRSKYSIEQKSFQVTLPTTAVNSLYQTTYQIVDPITMQGMRKVKHITLSLAGVSASTDTDAIGS